MRVSHIDTPLPEMQLEMVSYGMLISEVIFTIHRYSTRLLKLNNTNSGSVRKETYIFCERSVQYVFPFVCIIIRVNNKSVLIQHSTCLID